MKNHKIMEVFTMKRFLQLVMLFAAIILVTSCSAGLHRTGGNAAPSSPSPTALKSAALPETPPELKIAINDDSGKTLYTLKRKEGKYRILDAGDQIIGEVRIEIDRVKIKDKNGSVLWKIKKKDNGCKLTNVSDAELYKIRGSGGDFKIKDSRDSEVARIKIRGEYLEISGLGNGKVKSEGEGIKIEDSKGTVILSVKAGLKKEEGCFLGLTSLEPLQRIGLVLYFKEIK
jgi:hypothetical protein